MGSKKDIGFYKIHANSKVIDYLKTKLDDALKAKSSDASKIQEQIWLLKDYQSGHRRNLDEKKIELIYQSLPDFLFGIDDKCESDKKLRSLKKKLQQALALKEKMCQGAKLEKNQLEKIEKIEELEDEIRVLEMEII